jgi:virginiamycin B lyase
MRNLVRSPRPSVRLTACLAAITSLMTLAASSPASAAGRLREFLIPGNTPGPQEITVGSDGALWFTEINLGIGRLAPDGTFSNFSLSPGAQPLDIVSGPDGALWFTETYDDSIGRLTTDGQLTETLLCTSGCGEGTIEPWDIAVGSDGAIWFTELEANAIGRMSTDGTLSTFRLTGSMIKPLGLTAGPDGALWFTDAGGIGRITTAGVATQMSTAGGYSITTGPDGNLWFTSTGPDQVGRLTTTGQVTLFPAPAGCYPQDIASGLGALWFGCYYLDQVNRITTTGTVSVFPIPHHFPNYPDGVQGFVQGPGRVMSFVEYAAERVGRLQP